MNHDIPCCSPATTESVSVVRDKIADARSDILVGQGAILKSAGDNTSAILRDANNNALFTNSAVERSALGTMSQIDKFGLSNLNTTRDVGDKVSAGIDRSTYGLSQDIHNESDKITGQATTIAWAQDGNEGRRTDRLGSQIESVNNFQTATSDRASKFLAESISDSFARVSAQGENGFYRTGVAVNAVDKQVLKSECDIGKAVYGVDKQVIQTELSIGKSVNAGFSETNGRISDSYARLSEQNCDLKSAIAAAQAAAAECCCEIKQEILRSGKELGLQAAQNYGAIQVEASKNTAAVQLQAAVNHKESFLEQSKWFALAEKTAMINKCELEAKLAACCCEIKETVNGTAQATQALIQSNESARLRDALTAASTENAILKLRREEHHHYPYHHHHDERRGGHQ